MTGRFASLFARSGPPPGAPPPEVPPPGFEPSPSPAQGPSRPAPERERRYLVRLREMELRDIGGLAAEMARRDDWRYPLLHSRCAEVLALEQRIHELDALIAASALAARGVAVATCECGEYRTYDLQVEAWHWVAEHRCAVPERRADRG